MGLITNRVTARLKVQDQIHSRRGNRCEGNARDVHDKCVGVEKFVTSLATCNPSPLLTSFLRYNTFPEFDGELTLEMFTITMEATILDGSICPRSCMYSVSPLAVILVQGI